MTGAQGEPRWLDESQQDSWRALLVGTTLLLDRLDDDLRQEHGISLTEYEILVRLSEQSNHRLRMARLASALAHSRSRVTHTVARMETAGWVERISSSDDGRGVYCVMTPAGFAHLEAAARTHVRGVREHLVDLAAADDFLAVGRVMNKVADRLVDSDDARDIRRHD